MSEYQYYEFAAIDGPISDEGLRYARGCSTRAEVSRIRWKNVYHFGSFHGSEDTLLKYYDAHFYIANWATVRLGLAFPNGTIALEALQPYLIEGERYEDTLTIKRIGDRLIVWWDYNEDGGWSSTSGEGLIEELMGIREELMRGDYRALFLGWLADFHPDEWQDSRDAEVIMPPIPSGLDQLSPALAELIKHFPVDTDALSVAATMSQASMQERVPMKAILEKLSEPEMRALLARVAEGGGQGVMAELNRLASPPAKTSPGQTISCIDFASKAIKARKERLKKEAAAETAKRQREAERLKQHLASIFERAGSIWPEFDPLMAQKISSAYDEVANRLQELRDAYAQAANIGVFQQKLVEFRTRYSNRPAMLRRIEKL